ncbi:MAG: aldo/keto reductase [Armatimonadia bacterium]|nr:aldo/keto reductase [Armatimonadia bacterium]
MDSLYIPALEREVSRLGVGSMIFSPGNMQVTTEVLDAFAAKGGNLIDTAQCYGGGESERAIGLYMDRSGSRSDWVILDKDFDVAERLTPEAIPAAIEANLGRLATDYIDIWLFHRDNEDVPIDEIVDAMAREVHAGRIRCWGGSNWTAERVKAARRYAEENRLPTFGVTSPHVCLARSKEPFWPKCLQASDEELSYYARARVPVFAWSSQGRGFFLESSGPDDDSPDLVRVYHEDENFERLRRARELAERLGVEPIQIALAYVLNLPAPTVALVGPANAVEVASCVAASDISLTPDDLAWLDLRTDERS